MSGNLFCQVYRAVLSAGTPYGNGQITAAIRLKTGNPFIQKLNDVIFEVQYISVLFEKIGHFPIHSGQGTQSSLPMRIRQTSCIVDEVRVIRDAMFEAERLE